jgi:lipid A 4'-phosphatase
MSLADQTPESAPGYGTILIRDIRACPLLASALLLVLVSMIFWVFPGIDRAATELFYSKETWFAARNDATLMAFRDFGIKVSRGLTVLLVLLVFVRIAFWRFPAVMSGRSLAFLLSSAALGPGLLVNLFLKDFWGRPRPHMVEAFGGDAPYVPVWQISEFCRDNCSFVSGEAASAFWLIGFAFIVPKDLRLPVFVSVALFTLALSLNRVAFGGHFLSDVVISWCLTLFVVLVVRDLVLGRGPAAADPYDAFLTGIGRGIAGFLRLRTAAA